MDTQALEELKELIDVLPLRIKRKLSDFQDPQNLVEVVLDIGRPPEARFTKRTLYMKDDTVSAEDIEYVTSRVGEFTSDNRAGIERTLHRISCMRNRTGRIIGLTCRVGRSIVGTIDVIRDVVESGKNILFMGPPGIGKTTKLREAARVLSVEFDKRVIVVDTSNEIAGDGDIPHPGIGKARRMQVSSPDKQHAVMIEAVENHMPEVVIVDEIGTEEEAAAARTIAERGVQLIATAHGTVIDNILKNPTLSDLVGGIQTVILSDEEAKRRGTQKAVLERKAPPTFDMAVEIRERDVFAIYKNVASAIDALLRGRTPHPEIRVRTPSGKVEIRDKGREEMPELTEKEEQEILEVKGQGPVRIYPFGVNKTQLERAVRAMQVPAVVVGNLDDADIVLTTAAKSRPGAKIVRAADEHNIPIHAVKKNTSSQVMRFLRYYFKVSNPDDAEDIAMREANEAAQKVKQTKKSIDLNPQNAYIRRLQHQLMEKQKLRSESVGEEPKRRVRIYPQK